VIPDVQLSNHEKEVLKLVPQGQSNKQIALALDISIHKIQTSAD